MGRKGGPDIKKIERIRKALKENPQGLWTREIARKTGISKSTVNLYLNNYMATDTQEVLSGSSGFVKVVRLKG